MGAAHHGSEGFQTPPAEIEKLIRRFESQIEGRAKRAYSEGRIKPDDDGDLALAVAADKEKHVVIIDFGKSVTWLGMSPEQANRFANLILAKCRELGHVTIVHG